VLGGLLDEQFMQDEQGVAGISSVPVIGGLFKTKKKTKSKTNLMVFLRPSIIRHAEDTVDITRNRYTGILDDKRAVNPGPSQVLDAFSAGAVVRYPARESDYETLEAGKPVQAELLGPPEVEENVPGAPSAPQH
jgi:general secretion pathway protein D